MINRIEDLPKGWKEIHIDKMRTHIWISEHYRLITSGPEAGKVSFIGVTIYDWAEDILGEISKNYTDESYKDLVDKLKEAEGYEDIKRIIEDERRYNN